MSQFRVKRPRRAISLASTSFQPPGAPRGLAQPRFLSGGGQAMDRAGAGRSSSVLLGVPAEIWVSQRSRNRVEETNHWPCVVGMGGDLLASTGQTVSCGATTIHVPDAGWGRQRARPDVCPVCGEPGEHTSRASGQAPSGLSAPYAQQLGRTGPVLAANRGCARRAQAATAACSAATPRLQHARARVQAASLPCAAARAAPQLRSVLHASPVFLDTVPAKFRVSDDIGAA